MRINRQDTNGVKSLLQVGELGYDNWSGGGDIGRVYVGTGSSNIALAKKSEVDAKVVANANITAGTATKITYDTKGLVTSGTTLSAGDIPVLDAGKITTGTLPVARGGTGTTASTGTGDVVLSTGPVLVTPTIGVATGTSFNSITGLSSTTPVMDGAATAGTGFTVARADHVHPKDTTKVDANANITAGTYKSVTVDVKGLVTGGTNPTTLGGYGITDAYTKTELDDADALKVALADFIGTNVSLTENGYQKFPGGLIIQWGHASSSATGQATLTLPIVFPNAILSGSASYFVNMHTTHAVSIFADDYMPSSISALATSMINAAPLQYAQVKFIVIGY